MTTDTSPLSTVALASKMVRIDAAIKAAAAELDRLKANRAEVEETLLEQFAAAGVSSLKVDGKTVSLRRDLYARILDADRLHDELTAAGYGDLIEAKVNSARLSALVREFDRGEAECPGALADVVTASERYSIRVTSR